MIKHHLTSSKQEKKAAEDAKDEPITPENALDEDEYDVKLLE